MPETCALCLFYPIARTCYFAVGGYVRVRPRRVPCLTKPGVDSAAALSWVSTRVMELSAHTDLDISGYVSLTDAGEMGRRVCVCVHCSGALSLVPLRT